MAHQCRNVVCAPQAGLGNMKGKVFYVVFLVASALALANGECAPPEAIAPCTCEKNILSCGNVNEEQLRSAFTAQKSSASGNSLDEVMLTDYRLSFIPSGLLSGIDFYGFQVTTNSLASFLDPHTHKSAFEGIEDKLKVLAINYFGEKPVSNFDWSSLSPLKNLHNLVLSGSFAAFQTPLPSLPTVQILSVEGTSITSIPENTFAGFTGLKDVRISSNAITAYSRNILPNPASQLRFIRTTDKLVTDLPEDLYDNMPVLEYVKIPVEAQNIPQFKSSKSVQFVGGVGLTCDCKLKWLLDLRDQDKVEILNGVCKQPERLQMRKLATLTVVDIC